MAKRFKKILKIFLLSLAAMLFVSFLLFCILIMNPFAADYSRSLLTLAPANSDAVAHIAKPQQLQRRLADYIAWQQLLERQGFRAWCERLTRELRPVLPLAEISYWRKQILAKTDIDIADSDYLLKVLARETAVACKYNGKEALPEFLLISRVGWQIQLANGLLPYVINQKTRQQMGIEMGKVCSIRLSARDTVYWFCHRDVLLLANSRLFLEEAAGITEAQKVSLYDIRQSLQQQSSLLQEQEGDILWYAATGGTAKQWLAPELAAKLPGECLGRLNLKNALQIDLEGTYGSPNSVTVPLLSLTAMPGDVGQQLPAETFAYGTLTLDIPQIWPYIWSVLPPAYQRQAKPYLDLMDQHFQTKDFPAQLLQKHLEGPVIWCMALTDFAKENLQPLDPYPSVALLAKASQPNEFVNTMHEVLSTVQQYIMAREVGRSDFTVFAREQYAGRPYLRFKYPDSSGGAIQPAVGAVGPYVVLSSHTGFLKSMADLHDQLASPLQNTNAYHKMEQRLQEAHTIHCFAQSNSIVKIAGDFHEPLLDGCMANMPRAILMQQARKEAWRELLQDALASLGLLDVLLHLQCDISKDKVQGRIVLPLHIRK
jgi:hypothetical protein